MRKNIACLLAAMTLLAACKMTEDHHFDKSPDQRIAEQEALVRNTLLSSPNGWFLMVDTKTSGGFSHWVAFDENNRFSMLSDMDVTFAWSNSSTTLMNDEWRVRFVEKPLLVLDGYNYLAMLHDPQGKPHYLDNGKTVNGGVDGEGLKADIDFYINGVSNGSLDIVGRLNKCNAVLVPATPAETAAAMAGGLKTVHQKTYNTLLGLDFILGTLSGTTVEFTLATRQALASYIEGGKMVSVTAGAYLDMSSAVDPAKQSSDIVLFTPMVIKGKKITGFSWDQSTGLYSAVIDGSAAIPLAYNPDSPLPLNLGEGKDYTVVNISNALPGTDDPAPNFRTAIFDAAKQNFETNRSPRQLRTVTLTFGMDGAPDFNPVMSLAFTYVSGTTSYTGTWKYKYTDNGDGTITFTNRDQNGSSNEYYNERYITTLLDYFCKVTYTTQGDMAYTEWVKDNAVTVPKKFKLEWIKNKTAGSAAKIGSLTPVDTGYSGYVPHRCIGVVSN